MTVKAFEASVPSIASPGVTLLICLSAPSTMFWPFIAISYPKKWGRFPRPQFTTKEIKRLLSIPMQDWLIAGHW